MAYQLTALGISVLALRVARQVAVPARETPQFGAAPAGIDSLGDDAAANARRMG
jgi:hypothetical protein